MAQRFIACDREQSFLMPPDVREWLPEDHFTWFVLDAVASVELDAFYAAYRADGRSRPAFDPAMMVALILYAYARGNRSSRAIERACVENIAYRVIAAQAKPDHATLARFVERHQDALAGVFGDVLRLCASAGLVGLNVVAVDGSKVAATEHGQALYRQRQHIIESVFGNTKHNRGITRLHRRGRAAVRTEWRLCMATHNLLKLHNHQLATQAA